MGLEHSFTNYVKEKYYNELFEALQDFITDQVENLELRLNVVEEIDEVNLSDIEIKQIYIEDLPGTKIDFDILLEAHIEVSDINKRLVDEQEICYQRSEEHTSELQSRCHIVCRLLLKKKKI